MEGRIHLEEKRNKQEYEISRIANTINNLAEWDYMDREFSQESFLTKNPGYFPKTTVSLYVDMFKMQNPLEKQFDKQRFLDYTCSLEECPWLEVFNVAETYDEGELLQIAEE